MANPEEAKIEEEPAEVEVDLTSFGEAGGEEQDDGAAEGEGEEEQGEAAPKGKRKKRDKASGKLPTQKKQKDVRVSNSAGLPWDIQKALAQAIEADGGIAWFKMKPHAVKDICDRHPETFGLPGSRRRQQIRNKIKYWRTYSPEEYRSLLANFMARGPPVSSRTSATKAAKAASQVQLQATIGQSVQEAMAQMQAHQPDLFSIKMAMKAEAAAAKKGERKKLPIRADQEYETIPVDTKRPENNRGIGIFEFTDLEKDGHLYNGYQITMEGDIRDFMEDHYKAQLVGNAVLLRLPALSYSFLNDQEEYEKRAKSADLFCPTTEEAHQAARKRIERDASRRERLVLLEFPENLELSNKPFSPDSTDGEIDFDLLPITIHVPVGEKELPMTITRISWKVSVAEMEPRAAKKEAPEEQAQTKGAAKLANIF